MQPVHAARPSLRSRFANWLAPRLGLDGTRTPADWLVRLLFHAPRPGRRDVPQLVIATFVARLASEWQIPARAPLPVWLWRAFVKPARAGGVRTSVRAGIAGASLVWSMATGFAHRQQRRFDAALARLP